MQDRHSTQLGYPLYVITLLGVTHIMGGVGLLIPKVPRLDGVGAHWLRTMSIFFTRVLFTPECQ